MAKLRCPYCAAQTSSVLKTEQNGRAVERIRKCDGPEGHIFKTTELPATLQRRDPQTGAKFSLVSQPKTGRNHTDPDGN